MFLKFTCETYIRYTCSLVSPIAFKLQSICFIILGQFQTRNITKGHEKTTDVVLTVICPLVGAHTETMNQ